MLKPLQGRQRKREVSNDTYYEIYRTGTKMLNCTDFTEKVVFEPQRETTHKLSDIYSNPSLYFDLVFVVPNEAMDMIDKRISLSNVRFVCLDL